MSAMGVQLLFSKQHNMVLNREEKGNGCWFFGKWWQVGIDSHQGTPFRRAATSLKGIRL